MDLTQVLVDFKKFERSIIWHEFWHGRQKEENVKQPIFKKQKSNLPKNYTIPKELQTYLGAIKLHIFYV